MHLHLHPIVVHFPIALLLTAFGVEILSLLFKKENLHQAAWYNYLLGILATIAAILAAWWDGETLKHPIFYAHRNFAYATLGIALLSGIILSLIKKRNDKIFRIAFFISLLVIVILVSITGYFGGRLVYDYGIGVAQIE